MIYAPHFISNTELQEAGETTEQLAKLFHYKYEDQYHTTEITPHGIWMLTRVDHKRDARNTREYAENKF